MAISSFWLVTDLPHLLAQATATVLLSRVLDLATKGLATVLPTVKEGYDNMFGFLEDLFQQSESFDLASRNNFLEMLVRARIPIVFWESEAYWAHLVVHYAYDLPSIDNLVGCLQKNDYELLAAYLFWLSSSVDSQIFDENVINQVIGENLLGDKVELFMTPSTNLSATILLQQVCGGNFVDLGYPRTIQLCNEDISEL